MLKRTICAALAALILCACMPCGAVDTSATASILVDVGSGRVLYEKNADRKMKIASTTKLLTALVALREGRLSEVVKVSRAAACTEGSSMYLKEGEELTLEELLYGLMLSSGNDAAVAVAESVGGSVKSFVKKMNAYARSLGMERSSFANPHGLDDEAHYSTARDMAKLACAAVREPTLMRIASTRTAVVGGRTLTNHNKLLGYLDGCIGLKTGYTKASGRTLVTCARRNGQDLVAVTLQDGNDWSDHQALYAYGFSAYPARRLAVMGVVLEQGRLEDGRSVPLVAADGFSWPVAAGERVETRIELDAPLAAPLREGSCVGYARFYLDGAEIGAVELLCGRTAAPKLSSALSELKMGFTG